MDFKLAVMVYCVSFLIFLVVDLIWLRYLAGWYYRDKLEDFLADTPKILPALLFYALFVLGNLVFVVIPSLSHEIGVSLWARASLYGVVSYGTYELTNYSALKDWPISVTLIDLLWGVFISNLVALSGYNAVRILRVLTP
jgi:uncharacterized membrane protein